VTEIKTFQPTWCVWAVTQIADGLSVSVSDDIGAPNACTVENGSMGIIW